MSLEDQIPIIVKVDEPGKVNPKKLKNTIPWPAPTPEMMMTTEFEAVWDCIKTWDINVSGIDDKYEYSGATGNHVRAILDALGIFDVKWTRRYE